MKVKCLTDVLTDDQKVLIDANNAWLERSKLFNILDDLKYSVESLQSKSEHAYTGAMYKGCEDAIWFLQVAKCDVENAIKQLWAVCAKCKMYNGEALNRAN